MIETKNIITERTKYFYDTDIKDFTISVHYGREPMIEVLNDGELNEYKRGFNSGIDTLEGWRDIECSDNPLKQAVIQMAICFCEELIEDKKQRENHRREKRKEYVQRYKEVYGR